MKFASVLALATASAAFVIPNEQVFNLEHVDKEPRLPSTPEILSELKDALGQTSDQLKESFHHISDEIEAKYVQYSSRSKQALDDALNFAEDTASSANDQIHETYFNAQGWLQSAKDNIDEASDYSTLGYGRDGPSHGPPHDGPPPHHGPPHHGPPHHGPPHHGHHCKPNMTVYQLIAGSKYTTKLAALINEYDDLVEALNGTAANFTVFAPTDRAFAKIPDHAPKPSKEFLKALLSYHVSPEFYPAGRVLVSRTIPTLLKSSALGKKPMPQRLATEVGFKGLTVNFYSRVIAVDIFGTNGVIHGVDSIIIPPPSILRIIDLLPTEFSTLELGLSKTGLLEKLNSTDHNGGTFFAPSNFAFVKLGPRINAFLFSSYGLKYLEALLSYHVVPGQTLYSDAFYKGASEESSMGEKISEIPKGRFHVDLPTMLEDRSLSIDIARYGRLIEIRINTFGRVAISDGVAYDGVLHVVSDVIIPPKKLANGSLEMWDGSSELTEQDLKERLEPFVKRSWSDDL